MTTAAPGPIVRGSGTPRLRDRRGVCVLAILLSVIVGCAGWPGFGKRWGTGSGFSEEDLREDLLSFAAQFSLAVSRAGDRIVREDPRSPMRKRVLLWKIHVVPLVQEAALLDDPQEAYVEVLTMAILMRQYLTTGDGKEVFEAQQPIAVEVAERLEEDIVAIGESFIPPDQLEQLRASVEDLTRTRTISGSEFSIATFQRAARDIRASGALEWVINIPMSPFTALEGVGSGAAAIQDFNDTALRFSHIVEGLPTQLRWQAELLAYELESIESVVASRAALESFAGSADRLSQVVARYPDDLGHLLADSEATVAEARALLVQAQALSEPLRDVATQVNEASTTWATMLAPREPGEPEGRPFDVREWEAAARAIGEGAARLQSLAVELRSLGETPALAEALGSGADDAAARLEARGRSVVDHAAWRAFQLGLVFFLLLITYRLASRWIFRDTR